MKPTIISLGVVHQRGGLGTLGPQLIGNRYRGLGAIYTTARAALQKARK